jgi:hypothetical protein
VLRLQVPSTPDPYDDATSEPDRQAVLSLLPPRTAPADAEPTERAETVEPVEAVNSAPLAAEAVAAESS